MVPGKNGPREKWSPGKIVPGKMVPGKIVPGKIVPGKMVPGKMVHRKMVPGENRPRKIGRFFNYFRSHERSELPAHKYFTISV